VRFFLCNIYLQIYVYIYIYIYISKFTRRIGETKQAVRQPQPSPDTFQLTLADRVYVFCVSSAPLKERWVENMRNVLKDINTASVSSANSTEGAHPYSIFLRVMLSFSSLRHCPLPIVSLLLSTGPLSEKPYPRGVTGYDFGGEAAPQRWDICLVYKVMPGGAV
jgi:hypothetical protein